MNYVECFVAWAGESECPTPYLEWSALSLLAAACGNRIYIPYRIGNAETRIKLNMYTMLVGPSGNFKSFAMSRVVEVLDGIDYSTSLNLFTGHLTHSGLYEVMRTARRKKKKDGTFETTEMPWAGQLYLICDELAADVGGAEYADLLIRALTKMYHGGKFDDATRTNGHTHLEGYSLNVFFGTTLDWLILAITANTLLSGFFGRTVVVNCSYSPKRVYPGKAKRPDNWSTLYDYLTERIIELLNTEGTIKLSREALRVDEAWYLSRERPAHNDPTMQSSQRQHDLSLKLAGLLAIADGNFTIDDETLARAQDMTVQVVKWQREILPAIQKGTHNNPHEVLLNMILTAGVPIAHTKLYKVAYDKFGIRATEMDTLTRTWLEAGIIVADEKPRSKGGTRYSRP